MSDKPDEPFDVVDMSDLDKIEEFLMTRSGKAAFIPIDAHYLANVSMHLLREVRMHRAKALNENHSTPSTGPAW